MIVKIGTDRFWVKASNIERWAEILKSLPRKIPCKSKKDLAREYLGYKVDEDGRIVNADEVYGLFGVERAEDSFTIVGCNFIRQVENGYELTQGAIELVERFNQNQNWEKVLAGQLLKYSIRTRAIAYAMLNGGSLRFEKGYMKNFAQAYIDMDGKKYYVFSSRSDEVNINSLMNENKPRILGPFWARELGIADGEEIEFKGVNGDSPSLSSMSIYLKIPVLLFEYLGWIVENEDGRYILDRHRIKEDAGVDVYQSLKDEDVLDDIEILRRLIAQYSDARGFFPIGIVGSMLKREIDGQNSMAEDIWIDRYFVTGINKGKFKIKDHEQGQPRHGRGLLGNKDYQLIKLEITD